MWEHGGIDIVRARPGEMLIDAGEMVDAALAGLDNGENVTIPSLPDFAEWEAYEAARQTMLPKLSRNAAAPRYRAATANVIGA